MIKSYTYNDDLSRKWFIEIYFNSNEGVKKIQQRGDINKKPTISERKSEMKKLILEWEIKLSNGFNPFKKATTKEMNFVEAIDWCMEKKKSKGLAKNTIYGYNSIANQIKQQAVKLKLNNQINSITRGDIIEIISSMGLSNSNYNKTILYLESIISELEEAEIIERNPAKGIKKLKVQESEGYKLPKDINEYNSIISILDNKNPQLANFAKVVYKTLARPQDLLRAKISDYKDNRLKITNGKTKVLRTITIPKEIDYIFENINKFPQDWYIFGKNLLPSKNEISRKYTTDLWKKIVKPIFDVDLYGLKYFGVDQYLLKGIDIDTIRHQAGHVHKHMTERYGKQLKNIYHNKLR